MTTYRPYLKFSALLFLAACASKPMPHDPADTILPSNLQLAFDNPENLNHFVEKSGDICTDYDYDMPLAHDIGRTLSALDKDGVLGNAAPDITFQAMSSRTSVQCADKNMISNQCRVNLLVKGGLYDGYGEGKEFDLQEGTALSKTSPLSTSCDDVRGALKRLSAQARMKIVNMIRSYER